MGFSFKPLWKVLVERDMTKEQLRVELGLSPATVAKMGRGENVSMDVLNKICNHLNCKLEDVVEHISDEA